MQSTDAVKMGVIPDDPLDQLAKEVLLRYVTPMINAEAGYVSGFLDPDCHLKGITRLVTEGLAARHWGHSAAD